MARERKTFLAGYFYDWQRGDYFLRIDGLPEPDQEDKDVLAEIDRMIDERVERYGVSYKNRWFRFKIADLNLRVSKLKMYLAVYGL